VRVLFTGGSSFTGSWFVRELAAAGHQVTATFRQPPEGYADPLRRARVRRAAEASRAVYGVAFGDERFLALLREEPWDLLAHHGTDVTNYRSPDFDAAAALQANVRGLPAVLQALRAGGGRRVLLTGSVFEGGEGSGSQGLPDFSPYGLSKALTARTFQFHCDRAGLHLGKFVIPNPFGPWEEARYTHYLMRSWLTGATPSCASPAYVRDNVHVSLLARAYARFASDLPAAAGFSRLNPSGYAESQGAFTLRLAAEMRPRLGLPCPVELKRQAEFPEPRVRVNTDFPDAAALGWSESAAWDELADWYRRLVAGELP
jgi:nucleoside-diphosphate-sugar epimerase